jgi:hypothetical protein
MSVEGLLSVAHVEPILLRRSSSSRRSADQAYPRTVSIHGRTFQGPPDVTPRSLARLRGLGLGPDT